VDEKLTPRGAQALAKLTSEWKSPYQLREGVATLRALVECGLAEERGRELLGLTSLGMIFTPRTALRFRRKGGEL